MTGFPGDRSSSVSLERVGMTFYSGERTTEALREISFEVAEGEFVTLIGPSGSGKTTVLRIIADTIVPTTGRVTVLGDTPEEARKKRLVGFVFQEPALLSWRTVLGNILLPLEVMGDKKEGQAAAQEMLELVGLGGFGSHYPDEISGGMQQRVSIARALSYDPNFLLMDEPFGALDLITRERMGEELIRIWEKTQKTILFVTHSIEEAVLLSDRILVLSARPATIIDEVAVNLPRPRGAEIREDETFLEMTQMLREMLV